MIVAEQKPLDALKDMLKDDKKVLAVGCGTCVTVCFAGGRNEVSVLSSSLRLSREVDGETLEVGETTVQRQCEEEFLRQLDDEVKNYDAILSLGCGVGVQSLAERYPATRVLPALNTKFMGYPSEHGVWEERCQGCGNCVLHLTGGVCPVSRCAKQLFNGPCGGSQTGICEVDPSTECAWQVIGERAGEQGSIDQLMNVEPPKDWSSSRDGGHRRIVRDDLRLPENDEG